MSSASERFVRERKEYWEKIANIVSKIEKKGYKSLIEEEIIEFPNLYRKISTDSEIAKTLKLSPDTIQYLELLVKHSHNTLYCIKKNNRLQDIIRFIFVDFSKAFIKNIYSMIIIFLLFLGTTIWAFFYTYYNPEFINEIVPDYLIDMLKESYKQGVQRDINENIYMASYYIYNNVSISFIGFILGITFGIGTLIIIIYNGLTIGCIGGAIVSSGYGSNFFNFVIAHSAFELLGVVLTCGAGLAIGLSLIKPTDEKRFVVLIKKGKEVMPILTTGAFFIIIAAFIEGFISASKIDLYIKILIFVFSLIFIFILSYKIFFVKMGRKIFKK